ncbi:hypothetical protein AAMO2058_000783800 [Amorphochlora amoebiformis]
MASGGIDVKTLVEVAETRLDRERNTKRLLGIEDERFEEIKQIFSFFDQKRTGCIPCDDLGFVLRGLGFNVTEKQLADVINVHDKNGDGLITLPELISVLKQNEFQGPELFETDVISHFAVFDRNKDGFIDENDLIAILTQMEEKFTQEDVNALWKEIRVDGDKRINYVELVKHLFDTSRPPIGLSPWIDDEEKYAKPEAHRARTPKALEDIAPQSSGSIV